MRNPLFCKQCSGRRTALKPLTRAVQDGACMADLTMAALSCRCEQYDFSFSRKGKMSPSNMKAVFFSHCLLPLFLLTLSLPVVHESRKHFEVLHAEEACCVAFSKVAQL